MKSDFEVEVRGWMKRMEARVKTLEKAAKIGRANTENLRNETVAAFSRIPRAKSPLRG